MNSILPIHFGCSADDVHARDDVDALSLAIDRLGLYLDQGRATFSQVLIEAGHLPTAADLNDLSGLHLEPDCTGFNIMELLLGVRRTLVRALDEVAAVSIRSDQVSSSNEDFDTRGSWVCARLSDMIATLDWALN